MPREFLHWSILESAIAESLNVDDSGFGPETAIFDTYWPYGYLGALAHDAPYYLDYGKSLPGESVGDFLHGSKGENTFSVLNKMFAGVDRLSTSDERHKLMFFVWGMLSHIIVDAVFHPLVNYTTGNYYDTDPQKRKIARTFHRQFEVHLDWWCLYSKRKPRESYVDICIKIVDERESDILTTLGIATNFEALDWQRAYQHLAKLQRKFHSDIYGFLANIMAKILPDKYKEFEVLFSYDRRYVPESFAGTLTYSSMVSSDQYSCTLDSLYDLAVQTLTKYFIEMRGFLDSGDSSFLQIFSDLVGPSLESGLIDCPVTDLKNFAQVDMEGFLR